MGFRPFRCGKWTFSRGPNLCARHGWGTLCWVVYCEFRTRWKNRACHVGFILWSDCFAGGPGSAEIREFGLGIAKIGAWRWRVYDAAKQNLRNFCREIFEKCGFFRNLFGTRDFALYFCIEWRFCENFQVLPSEGVRANLSQIGVFWGVLSFCFGLILLAAYLHDGWWRGCTRTTRRRKKQNKKTAINDSNYWFSYFCVFFFFCCTSSAILFYILHAHGFLLLFSFSSFIIINTISLF